MRWKILLIYSKKFKPSSSHCGGEDDAWGPTENVEGWIINHGKIEKVHNSWSPGNEGRIGTGTTSYSGKIGLGASGNTKSGRWASECRSAEKSSGYGSQIKRRGNKNIRFASSGIHFVEVSLFPNWRARRLSLGNAFHFKSPGCGVRPWTPDQECVPFWIEFVTPASILLPVIMAPLENQ